MLVLLLVLLGITIFAFVAKDRVSDGDAALALKVIGVLAALATIVVLIVFMAEVLDDEAVSTSTVLLR